ncbi:IclR family transcriptional regulator [Nesterenkonia xinjiangensis]|uniref:IclR family acetate operon transcriptional repressor n=1 Tax=Nesterenkonia xinjiangensis TaxID=225327 RepID=A0A7Z0GKY1_9MICC|nr:IclR family transcriptional regulator [Nesterenkonia xinjiangensis]NYJ77648.1 IclR family acetate operon transcriptional repressor [Nesterenkonia xinjiangensis]
MEGPETMTTDPAEAPDAVEKDSTARRPTKGGVQSVERTFDLLSVIAASGGQTTLSELAVAVNLPMPTIHRLLKTLLGLGIVRQLPDRGYALGPGLIRLGDLASRQLGAVARPHLRTLVDELGESANVATLDGDMVVYVDQVPSPHQMRMFTEVGRRAHTHDTGVGKAILATLEADQVRRIVTTAGMPAHTEHSITTPEALEDELHTIRTQGYSVDEQEQELGVRCFAVSVPEAPAPLAISVSGPTSRVDTAFADRAVPLLRQVAARISRELRSS